MYFIIQPQKSIASNECAIKFPKGGKKWGRNIPQHPHSSQTNMYGVLIFNTACACECVCACACACVCACVKKKKNPQWGRKNSPTHQIIPKGRGKRA